MSNDTKAGLPEPMTTQIAMPLRAERHTQTHSSIYEAGGTLLCAAVPHAKAAAIVAMSEDAKRLREQDNELRDALEDAIPYLQGHDWALCKAKAALAAGDLTTTTKAPL